MFTIKDASNFNLENFPYDFPVITCENEDGEIESFGVGFDIWFGINPQSEIGKYMDVYTWQDPYNFYGQHLIKLNNSNVPEKYIVNYGG